MTLITSKKERVTCIVGHEYEVPNDALVAINLRDPRNGGKLTKDECLACLKNRLRRLRHTMVDQELGFARADDQVYDDAQRIEGTLENMTKLYSSIVNPWYHRIK